jgi:uncharacterized protein with von Willebrand factor type A (vWA) domain
MSDIVTRLLVFGRVLRAAGFEVPVGSMLDAIDALARVDVTRREDFFLVCRALLVRRPEQLRLFAALFAAFWHAETPEPAAPRPRGPDSGAGPSRSVAALISGTGSQDDGRNSGDRPAARTWSDVASIAHKDIGTLSDEEMARAQAALDHLPWFAGERRTRRWIRGRGRRLDLRTAVARAVRTGGDVITIPTRMRRVRPRRLILVCDVSGSMERYARLLVHFAHGLGQRHRRLEVFLFSTRLTRVTHQLRTRRVAQAASAVSDAVPDWSGGTRIGDALQEFQRRWSRRVMREGAVVLLISDGWDRGDPLLLRAQVARLQRSSYRLIWLNPLIGTFGYEPLTRGLQAALPYVDDFLPARTLADLSDLTLHLGSLGVGGHRRLQRRRANHVPPGHMIATGSR